MDTTISKMLKLIATIIVGGCIADGYLALQANSWGYLIGFCWAGAIYSLVFTLIWGITKSNVAELLGSMSRSDITKESIIGTAIAIPTFLVALGFVGGGVSAGMHGQFDTAHWLLFGAAFCCAILTTLWGLFEYGFLSDMKKQMARSA
jgi:hypothetical protein